MKSKFKRLIGRASEHPDHKRIMKNFICELDEAMSELKDTNPAMYWDLLLDLHEEINGVHFDEELATFAVSQLRNEDETVGGRWTIDQTNDIANSISFSFGDNVNEFDWYYVLNMIYSDFYNTVKSNLPIYYSLAKDWLMDRDAVEGKAFNYFKMNMK